jgi:Family of unknown function (DUF5719)
VTGLRLSRVLPVVIVVAVLAGVYGLAGLRHSVSLTAGSAPRLPRAVAVTSVTRVCPAPGASFSPGSGIAMMAAPASTGSASTGSASTGSASTGSASTGPAGNGTAVVSRLSGTTNSAPGGQVLTVSQPGAPRQAKIATDHTRIAGTAQQKQGTKKTKPKPGPTKTTQQQPAGHTIAAKVIRGGVVIQATGPLAQGLDVEQTTGTGLPTAACGSPGTEFWFGGPGQHTAGRIHLYLMNVSGQPADVSVDIFTDAGPLQDTTDTGITVPPHSMVVQSLGPALRNSRSMSLHVRTSIGQVAAAVQETTGNGAGAWLPAAQAPATRLLVPGLPSTAGTRQLFIAVPGVKDANVQVTAVTSRGTYVPTGASGIDLPGGSVAQVSLPSLSGIPAALKLTSNAPITADVMIPGGGGGSPGSFTAAAPALEEQGVVADNPSGAGRASALVLSAPHKAAQVNVMQVTGGKPARQHAQVVAVAAGKSVVVALRPVPGAPRGTPFAVVITPVAGSGPVYAGRVVTGAGAGGALQAMLPVASALITVPLPRVHSAAISAAN